MNATGSFEHMRMIVHSTLSEGMGITAIQQQSLECFYNS